MSYQNYSNEPQEEKSLWGYYVATITTNYFNYKGRARRKEFWGFALFNAIISIVLCLIGFIAFGSSLKDIMSGDFLTSIFAFIATTLMSMLFMLLYGLAVLVPTVCLIIRRLHDRGLSGWWYGGYIIASSVIPLIIQDSIILNLVSFIYFIWLFIQYCCDSKPGENKWGANPKEIVG